VFVSANEPVCVIGLLTLIRSN